MKKHSTLLIISIIAVAAIVVTIFIFARKTPAQDNTPIVYTPSEGLEFKLNEDGKSYTLIGLGECSDREIVIPNTYENLPVTAIGEDAFDGFSGSIVISELIDIIDERAFTNRGYKLLSKITVDENNKYYKSIDGILYSKDGKTLIRYTNYNYEKSFTVPDFVTNIDSWAFAFHYYLENIYIPESVKNIGDYAFADTSIRKINIPDSVTSISTGLFYECSSLQSVNIPESVTSIGDYAFYNCDSLENIEIPDSVTYIGDLAFHECGSLENIEIPDSITYMGCDAFVLCDSLVFYRYGGCYYLGNSENPFYALVEKISGEEYPTIHKDTRVVSMSALTESKIIKVDEDNEFFKSIDGDLYSKDEKTLIQCAGTSGHSRGLFRIPNTVEFIAEYAFWESDVCEIYIPSSVVDIGSTYIRDDYYSDRLSIIDVDKNNKYYQTIDGNLYTKDGKNLLRYAPGNDSTSFVVPDFVESIGEYAFYACDSLESIIIPESVVNIGDRAFAYLDSVTIYCEAKSQPSGWHKDWCYNYDHKTPVIWGYTGN